MASTPVVSIFGPTSVGKTAVGLALRERLEASGSDITGISADAYAVYREIPIITGAPTASEGEWLTVASRSVTDTWSAGEFSNYAIPLIEESLVAGGTALLVGGTGLYLQSSLAKLDLRPPVPHEIRAAVSERLKAHGPTVLHAELSSSSPEIASSIEPTDSQRITRALEALEMGETPSQRGQLWEANFRFPTRMFGLSMKRNLIRERISNRVDQMIKDGAEAEVATAWDLGPSPTAQAAIGMKELPVGDIDAMKTRTHQFAKRQETWMRKLKTAYIVDVTDRTIDSVADEIFEELDVPKSA